jgi:hypothetical protein
MGDAKHTPERWSAHKRGDGESAEYHIEDEDGAVLGEAFWNLEHAHLMAAAPMMLEALEEAKEVFMRYAEIHFAKRTPEGDRKAAENIVMVRQIGDAIAAAKGEG